MNIIDSHIHFWHPTHLRYSWLASSPILNRVYLPRDLATSGEGWTMEALVFVQADCYPEDGLKEAEWVAGLAEEDARIQGIVAYAPLEQGNDARNYLNTLVKIPLVKGVRRLIQSEPLGFSTQPSFVAGVKLLREYNLRCDLCIYHPQLPDIIELVRQCPEIDFVLDHIGKPGIKDGLLDPWRENIKTLAQFPNVYCKLSGLVTEADHQHWTPMQLQPYIEHVLEAFGTNRVMFGGDWPVVLLAASYENWVETALNATKSLSEDEKNLVFYQNAKTFYGLS
jgi:L-fuconolactonase